MKNQKIFKIGYNSRDEDNFYYHVDFSAPLNRNEIANLLSLPGINKIHQARLHICIQPGALTPVQPIQILESIINYFELIGYKNVGNHSTAILNNDLGRLTDPMANVLERLNYGLDSKDLLESMRADPIFPKEEFDMGKAKRDLDRAVKNEDYEKAAEIKDSIDANKKQEK